MKPIRNRNYCLDCNRPKMLFETEKKALNFIKFNADEIMQDNGHAPVRAYYCEMCGGWHVTSRETFNKSHTLAQTVVSHYHQEKERELSMKKEQKEKIEQNRVFFSHIENSMEKAEPNAQNGNFQSAKDTCYYIVESLRANFSNIIDEKRYKRLLERLSKCIDFCTSPIFWITETEHDIETASQYLKDGCLSNAEKAFRKAIRHLTKASEKEGYEEEKIVLLHRLEQVQDSIKAAIA